MGEGKATIKEWTVTVTDMIEDAEDGSKTVTIKVFNLSDGQAAAVSLAGKVAVRDIAISSIIGGIMEEAGDPLPCECPACVARRAVQTSEPKSNATH